MRACVRDVSFILYLPPGHLCKYACGDVTVSLLAVLLFFRSKPAEAQRAVKGLDGRFFAGKTVKAEIYDREKFDKNDLTG